MSGSERKKDGRSTFTTRVRVEQDELRRLASVMSLGGNILEGAKRAAATPSMGEVPESFRHPLIAERLRRLADIRNAARLYRVNRDGTVEFFHERPRNPRTCECYVCRNDMRTWQRCRAGRDVHWRYGRDGWNDALPEAA
jgi:hypothetical protein